MNATESRGLLRLYGSFSLARDDSVPCFRYDHCHRNLFRLREQYSLESVAGTGDTLSRSLRLLLWLSRHVRHANTYEQLEMNSLSLLDYSFDRGRDSGINCRMLANVFVEACLSLRIRSRTVDLHPLSPYDMDQHVVAIVWIDGMSRWVMLDPTASAYVVEAGGRMLSPWELRDRLAKGVKVKCNDGIDFGDDARLAAARYRGYMAKNLFYFQSPVISTFGSEACDGQRWVTCVPTGFDVNRREEILYDWREQWARRHGHGEGSFRSYLAERRSRLSEGVVTSSLDSFVAMPR